MVKSIKTGRKIIKNTKFKRKWYSILEVGAKNPKRYAAYDLKQAKSKAKKLLDTKARLGRKVVIREVKEIYYEK